MRNSQGDSGNPWFRVSRWLRASAWLPPGLALAWLATLATFVHGVGIMIAAWGATVSLVVLVVLLVERRAHSGANSPDADGTGDPASPDTVTHPAADSPGAQAPPATVGTSTTAGPGDGTGEETRSSVAPPSTPESPVVRPSADPDPAPTVSPEPPQLVAVGPATTELRVLTAEEAASVLRVDAGLIVTAIEKGELPGNQIGSHWRIDQGALARWLQGRYGERPSQHPSR